MRKPAKRLKTDAMAPPIVWATLVSGRTCKLGVEKRGTCNLAYIDTFARLFRLNRHSISQEWENHRLHDTLSLREGGKSRQNKLKFNHQPKRVTSGDQNTTTGIGR